MEEILLDMRGLFKGLEVEGLVPLDQVPTISINTKELPTLQGWRAETVGQTSTPTKPASTSKPTQEVAREEGEPVGELELVPTPEEGGSPQATALDGMAAAARQILLENPDIAQWMLEHLRMQPLVLLRPEDLIMLLKPVEDQPQAAETWCQ